MSKVYSFRLSDENPRESQAREVIEVWVGEGYSLRQAVVEALLNYRESQYDNEKVYKLLEEIRKMFLEEKVHSIEDAVVLKNSQSLAPSFLNAMKNSVKSGISSKKNLSFEDRVKSVKPSLINSSK